MILKCGIVLLSFYIFLKKTSADEHAVQDWGLQETLDFNALTYEDACRNNARAEWDFINNPTEGNLLAWEEAQAMYGELKRTEAEDVRSLSDLQSYENSLTYQLGVEEKPGDSLLNSTEWLKLVSFSGKASVLRLSTDRVNGTNDYSRHEFEKLLAAEASAEDKRAVWSSWNRLAPLADNFSSTLQLVSEAAKANGVETVASYWELLSGYTDGYERMKIMWEELTDLHKKLVAFVKTRLSKKYKIISNDTAIPAYLLGTLDGIDWISIAGDVMPYRDINYSIMKSLWEKNLRGVALYRAASAVGKSVLKEVPVSDFWKNSRFNHTCYTKLINFCIQGATRVSTCHQASIKNFLTAHKIVGKVLMSQMEKDDSHSVFNTANRYSGLEEGVAEFFSILSVSPGQMIALNLLDNSTDTEHAKVTSLLITALDVLPRLAYYMAADLWRLDVIKNGTSAPDELLKSWWEYRKLYEGLTTDSPGIPTFLDDELITSNKPYLPKFIGTVLAFQLYEYLTESTEVRYDSAAQFQVKPELRTMIQKGGANDWTSVMSEYLEIYDIAASALTSYFAPLVEYFENNSEDIDFLTDTQEADLRHLVELYGSVDVTTPAPVTARTSPTTTSTTTVISTTKPTSGDKNAVTKEPEISTDETPKTEGDSYSDGINTSKAVWAVAIVLLATITICIIAIFGRRRCVKSQTPKNRRYV